MKLYGPGGRPLLAGSLTRAEQVAFGQMEWGGAGKSTIFGGDLYLGSTADPAGAVDRVRRGEICPAPEGRCAARGAPSPSTSPGCASPTAASLETGWVDHLWALPDDALNAAAFPPGQAGITVAVVAETSGSRKRYRVTLSGDRAHSPVLRAWQSTYPPAFSYLTGDWTEITPWAAARRPRNCPPTSASGKR